MSRNTNRLGDNKVTNTAEVLQVSSIDPSDSRAENNRALAICYTPAPRSESPNLRARSEEGAAELYYSTAVVSFASTRRMDGNIKLTFITDVLPPRKTQDHLAQLNVEIALIPFTRKPPKGFASLFSSSLYTLDALSYLLHHPSPKSTKRILIDPDVVTIRPLDRLTERHKPGTFGVYPTGFPPEEVSQGVSAIQAGEIHSTLNPHLEEIPEHFGGEFYLLDAHTDVRRLLELADQALNDSLNRWRDGLPYLTTEEHLLNYGLRSFELSYFNSEIRRMWTSPSLRQVSHADLDLTFWHLPAEKHRGFKALGASVLDSNSWFWTVDDDEYRARLGRIFGIPRRPTTRLLHDWAAAGVRGAQRKLGRS